MKMFYLSCLFAAGITLFSDLALAGTATDVTLKELYIDKPTGNIAFIRINGSVASPPACASNSDWKFTLLIDTAVGKSIYSGLLLALANGGTVTLYGAGVCSEYSNVESLSAFRYTN